MKRPLLNLTPVPAPSPDYKTQNLDGDANRPGTDLVIPAPVIPRSDDDDWRRDYDRRSDIPRPWRAHGDHRAAAKRCDKCCKSNSDFHGASVVANFQ